MPWIRRSRLEQLVSKAELGDDMTAYGEDCIAQAAHAIYRANRNAAKLGDIIHRQRCMIEKLKELLASHDAGQATRKAGTSEQQQLTATEIVRSARSTIAAPIGGGK